MSLLQPEEGENGDRGLLELRAQYLMTFGTLARFKVGPGWLFGWIDDGRLRCLVFSPSMYVCVCS